MAAPGVQFRRPHLLSNLVLVAGAALTTTGAQSPSSASLSSLLAAAPPGYVEDTESAGTPVGEFDEEGYLTYLAPDDPNATAATLRSDGFVGGYGRSWTHQATGAGFAEIVVAFQGGRGARRWLTTTEDNVRQDPYYQSDIKVDGVGAYVGVRYYDPKSAVHAAVVSFVKGNDFFIVGFVSDADMADAAVAQSKLQYDFAAAQSIPPAEWPENARTPPGLISTGSAVLVLALVALVAAGLWFIVRRRVRPAAATAGFMWDGRTWRSADGKLWWDGNVWREVPETER